MSWQLKSSEGVYEDKNQLCTLHPHRDATVG